MRVENARRLTGRGFFSPRPGAAVELWLEGEEAVPTLLPQWNEVLDALLVGLGLLKNERFHHIHERGLTTAVTAPIDRCLALADALEQAAQRFAGSLQTPLPQIIGAFHAAIPTEADPGLVAFERAAREHEVPFLWDDDEVSLGLGAHSRTWPARALPGLETIAWQDHAARIPTCLVTGTNGKTTTTRMSAAILRAAGYRVGMSSTDAMTLDGQLLEAGDWTGPGAARRILRHPEVTAAVLETARGGILRRGLGWDQADAALVTNVGADHFGDYGITSLEAMAAVKAVVWQGVRAGGKRIANVACPVTLAHLRQDIPEAFGAPGWVLLAGAFDADGLVEHLAAGGEGWAFHDGALWHCSGGVRSAVIEAAKIPATFGGTARHNVENAMAAAALASALGVDHVTIASALERFGASPDDNPGRLERYELGALRVVLDFAHNPHGVRALAPAVRHLREGRGRLLVSLGQAGDRSVEDLDGLAREVLALGVDGVWLRPMPGYERGRTHEEMNALLSASFGRAGFDSALLFEATSEVDFLERASAGAKAGDLLLVLVHYQRAEVRAWLARHVIGEPTPGQGGGSEPPGSSESGGGCA